METEKRKDNNYSLLITNYSLLSPPEAHYTVYKLTDPEGKIYIGCTGQAVEKRWLNGRGYMKKSPVRTAIDTYGWENFRKEILCERLTKAGAEKKEQWFIAFYDSSDPSKGYNRFLGGLGKGARMSEVTRRAASEAKTRLYEEHPEIREKIRNTVKSLYAADPTYRRRIGQGVLAAHEKDPTIRVRLREISKERWRDPSFREKSVSARRKALEGNQAYALAQRRAQMQALEEHPERRELARQRMRQYLSKPENRAFIDADSRPRPVRCVETGVCYPSQHAAEQATGFRSIHRVCSGRRHVSGGFHWEYVQ